MMSWRDTVLEYIRNHPQITQWKLIKAYPKLTHPSEILNRLVSEGVISYVVKYNPDSGKSARFYFACD